MRKFVNNAKTTLAAALTNVATSMQVADQIMPSMQATTQDIMYLTISDNANPALETVREIVAVKGDVSPLDTTVPIIRGLEDTLAVAWPAGSSVQCRVTADTLGRALLSNKDASIPQLNITESGEVFTTHSNNPLQQLTKNAVAWQANHNYSTGSVVFFPGSGRYGYCVQIFFLGQSGATEPTTTINGLLLDNNVVWYPYAIGSSINSLFLDFAMYVEFGMGAAVKGVSFGKANSPLEGLAIGVGNLVSNDEAYAFGQFNSALHYRTVLLGSNLQSQYTNSLFTSEAPGVNLNFGLTSDSSQVASDLDLATNLSGVIWSGAIDLTGGAVWTANSPVKDGQVRRPSTANGFQYVRSVGMNANFTPAANTAATQPTFPTTQGAFVADGVDSNGNIANWVAFPNVGRLLGTLPNNFIVEEIGILVLEFNGITTQPFVSFGKSGNNTLLVPNTQTTGLTAANKVQRFVLSNTEAINQPTISINTLAVGTSLLCRVYFKGFWVRHWLT